MAFQKNAEVLPEDEEMNEADPTKAAVEKMKQAAMIGTQGSRWANPIHRSLWSNSEEALVLPPHKIASSGVDDVNQQLPERQKIPAAQLARVVFKLSTGRTRSHRSSRWGKADC
jgi:hypothetical protein